MFRIETWTWHYITGSHGFPSLPQFHKNLKHGLTTVFPTHYKSYQTPWNFNPQSFEWWNFSLNSTSTNYKRKNIVYESFIGQSRVSFQDIWYIRVVILAFLNITNGPFLLDLYINPLHSANFFYITQNSMYGGHFILYKAKFWIFLKWFCYSTKSYMRRNDTIDGEIFLAQISFIQGYKPKRFEILHEVLRSLEKSWIKCKKNTTKKGGKFFLEWIKASLWSWIHSWAYKFNSLPSFALDLARV